MLLRLTFEVSVRPPQERITIAWSDAHLMKHGLDIGHNHGILVSESGQHTDQSVGQARPLLKLIVERSVAVLRWNYSDFTRFLWVEYWLMREVPVSSYQTRLLTSDLVGLALTYEIVHEFLVLF